MGSLEPRFHDDTRHDIVTGDCKTRKRTCRFAAAWHCGRIDSRWWQPSEGRKGTFGLLAPKGTFGLNPSLQYFDEFRSVKKNFRPRKCLFAPKVLALGRMSSIIITHDPGRKIPESNVLKPFDLSVNPHWWHQERSNKPSQALVWALRLIIRSGAHS